MGSRLKRGLRYIIKGIPEYKIEVHNSTFEDKTYLKDKIVLVTGGSRGIGFAIAKRVVESGGKVIITGRNIEELKEAEKKLGSNSLAKILDNLDVYKFDDFLEEVTNKFGEINCLVNNAGVSYHEKNFMEVTEKNWDEQMSINLKGTYFMSQSYIKYYEKHKMKNAKIINIVSETAGQPTYRPYGISKAALSSFTKWIAREYISKGIRINAIAPGVTESSMTHYSTKGQIYRQDVPGKRVFDSNEIAEVCAFLLSDASNSIAGQIIACNEANVCFEN